MKKDLVESMARYWAGSRNEEISKISDYLKII